MPATRFRSLGLTVTGLFFLLLSACGPAATATPTSLPGPTSTPTPLPNVPLPVVLTATPTTSSNATAVATPTSAPTPTPNTANQPRTGGTVILAEENLTTFDAIQASAWGWWPTNNWSQIIRLNPTDRVTVEGDLAESWTLSPDGLTYQFKMRPGVVDHAGQPYTADDAYYGMVRYIEQPNRAPSPRQACLRSFVRKIWDANKQPLTGGQAGAEVTAPNELTIRLVAPRAAFVGCFAGSAVVFSPSRISKTIDAGAEAKYRDLDPSKGELVGTGPFKVTQVEIGNFINAERHTGYHFKGRPYLDGYRLLTIPDANARISLFSVGRIDAFPPFPAVRKRDADKLKQDLGDKINTPTTFDIGFRGADLNVRRAPFGPVGDPKADKIRWAMQIALDRQQVNILAADGAGFLSTPYLFAWEWIYTQKEWLEQFKGLDSTPTVKGRDLAEAQKLMQEAGYGPNNLLKAKILASVGVNADMSDVLAQEWKKIYMDIEVVKTDQSRDIAATGDFDMLFQGVGAAFADPDAYNTSIYLPSSEGGFNFTGWTNPQWKALLDKALVVDSQEARRPLLREMARILYDDATQIGALRQGLVQPYRGNWRGYVPPLYHAQTYTLENVWLAP